MVHPNKPYTGTPLYSLLSNKPFTGTADDISKVEQCDILRHVGPMINIISMAQVGPLDIVYFIGSVPCELVLG